MSNLVPVVSRPGGKRQLLGALRPLVDRGAPCYVEPFVGGGALWLDTAPPRAVVGDADESLVDVYRACRDAPDELLVVSA